MLWPYILAVPMSIKIAIFQGVLPCAQYSNSISYWNPHINLLGQAALSFPSLQMRNWGSERLEKIAQLLNDNQEKNFPLPSYPQAIRLFVFFILYEAVCKWTEINIKSMWGNWKLNHPFSRIFICCWVHTFIIQLWDCHVLLWFFFSLQFCAGNPKEDFSYYCVWSKLKVACKKKNE